MKQAFTPGSIFACFRRKNSGDRRVPSYDPRRSVTAPLTGYRGEIAIVGRPRTVLPTDWGLTVNSQLF